MVLVSSWLSLRVVWSKFLHLMEGGQTFQRLLIHNCSSRRLVVLTARLRSNFADFSSMTNSLLCRTGLWRSSRMVLARLSPDPRLTISSIANCKFYLIVPGSISWKIYLPGSNSFYGLKAIICGQVSGRVLSFFENVDEDWQPCGAVRSASTTSSTNPWRTTTAW